MTLHSDFRGPTAAVASMPLILWSLALVMGILLLLTMQPHDPPAFEQLTAYTCDPLLPLPSVRGSRGVSTVTFTCRSNNQTVSQHGSPPAGTSGRGWQSCRRSGGTIKIWRYANPSPYGSIVFQSACNGEIYADYATQIRNYKTLRASGLIAAWALVILSAIGLVKRPLYAFRRPVGL